MPNVIFETRSIDVIIAAMYIARLPASRLPCGRAPQRPYHVRAASSDNKGVPPKPIDNGSLKAKKNDVTAKPAVTPEDKKPTPKPLSAKPVGSTSDTPAAKVVTAKPASTSTAPTVSAPGVKTFSNRNRFVVPSDLRGPFDDVWEHRKSIMETAKGFQGLKINDGAFRKDGAREVAVLSEWSSIPEWEAYACLDAARRSHLPAGIFQYVPKRGEGFPEDFTPFVEYTDAVNAKY